MNLEPSCYYNKVINNKRVLLVINNFIKININNQFEDTTLVFYIFCFELT